MTYTPDQLRHQAMLFERSELNNEAAMLRAGADAMEREAEAYATMKEMAGAATQARNQAFEEAAQHLKALSDTYYERGESRRDDPFEPVVEGEKEDAVTGYCFGQAADAIRAMKDKSND